MKACSPVFESILQESYELQSVVYLRGINQLELKTILEFIYSGQASFQQERMKEFLEVGKDLQIMEIKDVPEEENTLIEESVDEIEKGMSTAANGTSQHMSVPSNSTKCPQCDVVFVQRRSMLEHIRYKHEGVRYPCSQCDYKSTKQFNLKTYIESVHEGFKYPCSQCDYKATQQINLKIHIESVHEGVRYPCSQCDYKATQRINLKIHIESVHEGVKYPCSQCGYKATSQSSFRKHMNRTHKL